MVELRRAPALVVDVPALDDDQRRAVEHRGRLLRVLGAPGTGKTTTAVEVVVHRVAHDGLTPDACLLLTASRTAAARLRDRVTARVGGTTTEPLARTHQAFGFGILRREAALRGEPAPRLLSGPEQDVVLRDLLAGHASGEVPAPQWPAHLGPALERRGFRAELRDLLMRAVEHGLEPEHLAALGEEHHRPEWVAAARVLREYDEVTALSRPGGYDPAWILTAAADRLEDDPQALARLTDEVRLVVVDDAQELTSAGARLLGVLARAGVDVVLVGDPDSAVQTFRGADPHLLASGWVDLAPTREPWPTVVLGTSYRQGPRLREATDAVARRIGAIGGGAQRSARPHDDPARTSRLDVALLRAVPQEAAHVAAELRRAHLLEGVPWGDMAVIVRGRSRDAALRRALAAQGVPVAAGAAEIPVRDEVAVRPLLTLLDLVLRVARDPGDGPTPDEAVDLLLSPLGECDAVRLRRLRRLLRRVELDQGGQRTSDELLGAGLLDLGATLELGADGAPLRRLATAVARGLSAARVVDGDGSGDGGSGDGDGTVAAPDQRVWAPGVTAEEVLWEIWRGLDVAATWRTRALRGGSRGLRSDRDLDAVVALFGAVAAFVDRLPGSGPDAFLEHVRSQDVPGDTLVPRAPDGQAVAVLTPALAAGLEWPFVVVAGVQEGVWPDLRLRGSLLGSEDLVAVATGRGTTTRAAQAAVRYDETRLFHVAVSRASQRLLVTAVRSEDEQPSVYLDLVDPPAGWPDAPVDPRDDPGSLTERVRQPVDVAPPLTLPALVARLRRDLVTGTLAQARSAAAALRRLAVEGVPGADPGRWWALRPLSDDRPLRDPGQQVRVSPSKVEAFEACGLRWLLTTAGGDSPSVGRANLGTLVHDIAHDLGDDVDAAALVAEVDKRWGRLGLPPGWATDRLREEAHGMVTRLVDYYERAPREGWELVGSEVAMTAEIGRAVVTGRVDRLERDGHGAVRVLDYKTGSTVPTRAAMDQHLQLAIYQVAVEAGAFEAGSDSAGAAILRLGRKAPRDNAPLTQSPLSEHDDPGWARAVVERVADGMAGAAVLARADPDNCTFCPVRSSCPIQPEGDVVS